MKKSILHILFASALALTASPALAIESDIEMEGPEASLTDVQIQVSGHTLRIVNAEGKKLAIYDTAGNLVYSGDIDSNEKLVTINGRGIFIVKIDQKARKIQIR